MAVKIADTLKALSNTFPVAECVDIDVNINGTTKRLQKAIDDGEIGGGESTWNGTREEWEVLSTEEKGKYEVVYFTDDYDSSGIGSDSSWKGTKEEWENLLPTEKEKYEVVYFTDDYDGSGSYSLWKGTLEEWESLSAEEKGKYEIVCFTNDYDVGLIDDSNISNKTTYSSTKIENSLSNKANATDLTAHTGNTSIHVTTSDKTKWNKVDNKIDKTDIVDNLTSTDTNKPLSANQGKILKGEIGLKANATDLTTHTSDTDIHITTSERDKWNNKANNNEVVKKADIKTTLDENSTNDDVCGGKAIFDAIQANAIGKETILFDGNITSTGTYTLADDVNNYDFIIINYTNYDGTYTQSVTMNKIGISRCSKESTRFMCNYGYASNEDYISGYFNNDKLIIVFYNRQPITSIIGYKFGEVTVQNTITNPSPGESYSTDEQLTGGTWIDGKPIYRKSWTGTGNPNSFNHNIDSLGDVIKVDGCFLNTGSQWMNFAGSDSSGDMYLCRAVVTPTQIIFTIRNYSMVKYTLSVQYTKTTD